MAIQRPVCMKTFKLNDGTDCPAVGLGTFQGGYGSENEEALMASIVHALKTGYRLIDTASAYGIESVVGKAVDASGIPRSEITVITKFWANFHDDPGEALDIALKASGLDYIDIFLMHLPCAQTRDGKTLRPDQSPTFIETWKLMESLIGPKCKAIGVSNFSQKTLGKLLETATIHPVVNQIEIHAFHPSLKLVPYCQSKGIHVIAWRTLGGMGAEHDVLTHEMITGIAKVHGCSAGVVSLSWVVQRGCSVLPKSTNSSRIEDNIKLLTLSDDEMAKMNSAHEVIGKYRIADFVPQLQVMVDGKQTIQGWTKVDLGWEDEEGNWLT